MFKDLKLLSLFVLLSAVTCTNYISDNKYTQKDDIQYTPKETTCDTVKDCYSCQYLDCRFWAVNKCYPQKNGIQKEKIRVYDFINTNLHVCDKDRGDKKNLTKELCSSGGNVDEGFEFGFNWTTADPDTIIPAGFYCIVDLPYDDLTPSISFNKSTANPEEINISYKFRNSNIGVSDKHIMKEKEESQGKPFQLHPKWDSGAQIAFVNTESRKLSSAKDFVIKVKYLKYFDRQWGTNDYAMWILPFVAIFICFFPFCFKPNRDKAKELFAAIRAGNPDTSILQPRQTQDQSAFGQPKQLGSEGHQIPNQTQLQMMPAVQQPMTNGGVSMQGEQPSGPLDQFAMAENGQQPPMAGYNQPQANYNSQIQMGSQPYSQVMPSTQYPQENQM